MAKVFTDKELESIRGAVQSTCVSKGISPMIDSPYGKIVNPKFSDCVQRGYDDAINSGNQGKLSQWFGNVGNFIQSQGGIAGTLQNAANLYTSYQQGYQKGKSGEYSQSQGVEQFEGGEEEKGSSNLGVWLILIVLLLLLIVFSIIYFNKQSKKQ